MTTGGGALFFPPSFFFSRTRSRVEPCAVDRCDGDDGRMLHEDQRWAWGAVAHRNGPGEQGDESGEFRRGGGRAS